MTTITFEPCYIWSAYSDECIGTKVGNPTAFESHLADAVANHDVSRDRAVGQHFVILPTSIADECGISCGDGKRTTNPADYVLRSHRGVVGAFLKRHCALPIGFLACVVYTKEAMLADPQSSEEYKAEVAASSATHFLVAVIANGEGVPNTRSCYRLCDALAGGNNEAAGWSVEEIRELAAKAVAFDSEFCVVADEI